MALGEVNRESLALALFGTTAVLAQTSGTVSNEAITAQLDEWVPLTKAAISAVVVTNVAGTTTYALERDLLWDAIKKHAGWETEVAADVKAERTDIHGIHVVKPGESLSKIAKIHLDDANRYMDIFNANKDKLKSPDLIHPGQELVIPNR